MSRGEAPTRTEMKSASFPVLIRIRSEEGAEFTGRKTSNSLERPGEVALVGKPGIQSNPG
jgi:hypothetical protein